MRMTIRFHSGLRVEAVLLAANTERMRVVIDSQRDTIELHKMDACWYMEDGAEIQLEALIPMAGTGVSAFCDTVYPRISTAGPRLMIVPRTNTAATVSCLSDYRAIPPVCVFSQAIAGLEP